MGFSHENSKGVTYHLHKRGHLYFFSKNPEDSVEKPPGYTVVENKKTGLPMLKKE